MLSTDPAVIEALRSSQSGGVLGVARYRGASVDVNIETAGTVTFNGSSDIQSSCDVKVIGHGQSLVPRADDAMLAPNGQELALWRTVTVGGLTNLIPLGVFRITRAGDGFEHLRDGVILDWSVELTLEDRFEQIIADDFLAVESPRAGNSVWGEIQRLSPIPVQQSLTDAAVPPATVYESRMDAIRVLMEIVGGTPHLTREGVLTARPRDGWLTVTQPAFDLPGVIEWSDERTIDFFNQVQVSNPNTASIVAYARLDEPWNPRSVQNAGGRTYKHSSPIYTTQAAAQAAAWTILQRVSAQRANVVDVVCGPEALLLELGDVGWIRDPVRMRAVYGEVAQLTVPLDPTRPVAVQVIVALEIELTEETVDQITFFTGYPSGATFPDLELYPSGGAA